MKKTILLFISLMPFVLFSQNQSRFKCILGITYDQEYPNGAYIKNLYIPNIETGFEYRINRDHFFGICTEAGLSTHNFGLKRYSDNYSKIYLRIAPYAGLKLLADFDKNNDGKIFQSVWVGSRLAFYNCFNPNAFFIAGLNLSLLKHTFYLKWSTPLFYSFPDQDLWAKPVDMDDYYYPLGNERWSITAGVQVGFGIKK